MPSHRPPTPKLIAEMRVLILDDDITARSDLRYMLARAGVTRITDASVSAYEKVTGFISRIDMIFSELQFRAGKGIDILKAIRAGRVSQLRPDTPFAFVAKSVNLVSASDAGRLKADGLLIKPVSYEKLHPILLRARLRKCANYLPLRSANASLMSPLWAQAGNTPPALLH